MDMVLNLYRYFVMDALSWYLGLTAEEADAGIWGNNL